MELKKNGMAAIMPNTVNGTIVPVMRLYLKYVFAAPLNIPGGEPDRLPLITWFPV